jgi:hypothetical protein
MMRPVRGTRVFATPISGILVLAALGCGGSETGSERPGSAAEGPAAVGGGVQSPADTAWLVPGTPEDWEILRGKIRWGREEGLDTLDVGEAMARLGVTFVGTTYTPGTLELEGPERVVINLRELDCVTFVENVMAITDLIRDPEVEPAMTDAALETRYASALMALRYRDGHLDGYPSRLHYFSEWIGDHQDRGLVREVTADLGGEPYPDPVRFMSSHPDAYPHLADSDNLEAVRAIERALDDVPRWKIPQETLSQAAAGIRNGDVIAATSTVDGLDVAHTGLALWVDGRLHLLHAPLVGRSVEVSEAPLAERIREISGQDGVMVARPTGVPLPAAEGS